MRLTIDVPDPIHQRAKAKAAELGISLRQFVLEAVTETLGPQVTRNRAARLKWAGQLKHLRNETARINAIIEEEFERD